MNKRALVEEVLGNLKAMAARAEDARRKAQEEANSHLGRLESRYDTFKEEAQYLEAAQQQRAAEMVGWIRTLEDLRLYHPELMEPAETVRVGAVVSVSTPPETTPRCYFLLPVSTGDTLTAEGREVELLSLNSPLARSLRGRRPGDVVPPGAGQSRLHVLEVA